MNEEANNAQGTNLADLANKLAEAKKAIPNSRKQLKDKPKSAESYLICKDGTIAETDHSGLNDGRVILKETKE